MLLILNFIVDCKTRFYNSSQITESYAISCILLLSARVKMFLAECVLNPLFVLVSVAFSGMSRQQRDVPCIALPACQASQRRQGLTDCLPSESNPLSDQLSDVPFTSAPLHWRAADFF